MIPRTPRSTLFPSTTLFRSGVARVYEARVLGEPDAHDISRLAKGVSIEGRRTGPAEVVALGPSHLRITVREGRNRQVRDRKSTRLNSSHITISYAVFCLKKK